jgi:hypothetical protein
MANAFHRVVAIVFPGMLEVVCRGLCGKNQYLNGTIVFIFRKG